MSEPSARHVILHAVRAARPPAVAAPTRRVSSVQPSASQTALLDTFAAAATAAGAAVVVGERSDVSRLALGTGAESREVLSTVAEVTSTIASPAGPHSLASLDLFVCDADLGVAENGAVWIATADPLHRAALFLAARVAIVVRAGAIVATLHDAYDRMDVRAHAFGVFIAGPSKTADIEQSLVIGAHGPRELTVIVVGDVLAHPD